MTARDDKRARQLMALAVGSPYSEEGRTAALAAVRLIVEHDMLTQVASASAPQGLAKAPLDDRATAEVTRLRAEVARLRAKRQEPPAAPVVSALMVIDAASKAREIETLRKEVERLRALVSVHVVKPGESPWGIARTYTGSPARVVELVGANPRKPRILTPSGWTFAGLFVGERLRLPVGWV